MSHCESDIIDTVGVPKPEKVVPFGFQLFGGEQAIGANVLNVGKTQVEVGLSLGI